MSKKKTVEIEIVPDEWMQGFSCAAGIAAQICDDAVAQEIVNQGGFDREKLVQTGCEQYDIDLIFPPEDD